MDIMTMKKTDFKDIPRLKYGEKIPLCDSLVIVPERYKHDSSYLCMSFVGCVKNEPIFKLGGDSDVVHIDGIGGYGEWEGFLPKKVLPKGWSIDCLPCGYLRLFIHGKIKCEHGFCDFNCYGVKREEDTE